MASSSYRNVNYSKDGVTFWEDCVQGGKEIAPVQALMGILISSYCWKSETVVRVCLLPQVSNIPGPPAV